MLNIEKARPTKLTFKNLRALVMSEFITDSNYARILQDINQGKRMNHKNHTGKSQKVGIQLDLIRFFDSCLTISARSTAECRSTAEWRDSREVRGVIHTPMIES